MAIDKFLIEASHIMMFARSVGDDNPVYYDEGYQSVSGCKGIIAPPTFAQSSAQFDPNYFLRPKIGGEGWFGSGKEATGAKPANPEKGSVSEGSAAAGLHAEQHFEYHLPLKAGDILSATTKPGNTWEKESKRAGKLKFSESVTEYRNQNGDLVITATGVGVQTERPVDS